MNDPTTSPWPCGSERWTGANRKPESALPRIAKALAKNGRLFIDGGDPLLEISLEPYR